MAIPPTTQDAFLREVDEELRRDELAGFWQRYGRWLIAGLIVALGAFGGWIWWTAEQDRKASVEGEKLDAALQDATDGKMDAANAKLATIAKESTDGYRASAKMTQAAIALEKQDVPTATRLYGEVATDASLPAPWRNMALIRQTATEFETLKPEAIVARLKPLAVKGNPFFGSAGEMVAISYLNMGKPDLAGRMFGDIAKDEQVPETIRSRAVKMAGVLGVDVVDATSEVSN